MYPELIVCIMWFLKQVSLDEIHGSHAYNDHSDIHWPLLPGLHVVF